jgi:hypothetical protein
MGVEVCGAHEFFVSEFRDMKGSVKQLYDLNRGTAESISDLRVELRQRDGETRQLFELVAQREEDFRKSEDRRARWEEKQEADTAAILKAVERLAHRRRPIASLIKYASIVLTALGGGAGLTKLATVWIESKK